MNEVPTWAARDIGLSQYYIGREFDRVAKEFGASSSELPLVVQAGLCRISYPKEHLNTLLDWFSDVYIVPLVRSELNERYLA